MQNKLKIAAVVLTVIVGMVLYKTHFDKRKQDDDEEETRRSKSSSRKYN